MPTTTYCSYEEISFHLTKTTTAFTGTETDHVDKLIVAAEDTINERTKKSWKAVTVTAEPHKLTARYVRTLGIPVRLFYYPIVAGSLTAYRLVSINDWDEMTENSEYFADYDNGIVYVRHYLLGDLISKRHKFDYQYRTSSSVPYDIWKATVLQTCIDLVANENFWHLLPVGGDSMDLDEKVALWREEFNNIMDNKARNWIPAVY